MILYIIRHGDPDYAQDCLTPKGEKQAELLARRMKACALTAIYSSPRGRARETAMATAALSGCPVTIEPALQEIEYKVRLTDTEAYSDIRTTVLNQELQNADADLKYSILNQHKDIKGLIYDDMQQFLSTTGAFLDLLTETHGFTREGGMYRVGLPGEAVIGLFCHGNLGLALVAYLLDLPLVLAWKSFRMETTGVTRISIDENPGELVTAVCTCLSDLSHLANMDV